MVNNPDQLAQFSLFLVVVVLVIGVLNLVIIRKHTRMQPDSLVLEGTPRRSYSMVLGILLVICVGLLVSSVMKNH